MNNGFLHGIRLVVLDVDGTLVDAFDDIHRAALHTLQTLGRAPVDPATVRSYVGNGAVNLMRRLLKTDDKRLLREAVRLWTEYSMAHPGEAAKLYPGALDFLRFLRAAGMKSAALSNKIHEVTVALLEKLGAAPLLDAVWGDRPDLACKPDPAGLLALMGEFAVAPGETLVVGDGRPDIEVARAAGTRSCGVVWGQNSEESLRQFGADMVVDSFDALRAAILPVREPAMD